MSLCPALRIESVMRQRDHHVHHLYQYRMVIAYLCLASSLVTGVLCATYWIRLLLVGSISSIGTTTPNATNSSISPELKFNNVSFGITNLPNIIFMMADDMGYGDVHYNGGTADTPNLDAMSRGKHSVRMTRFYRVGQFALQQEVQY